jgi:hypothetical protein
VARRAKLCESMLTRPSGWKNGSGCILKEGYTTVSVSAYRHQGGRIYARNPPDDKDEVLAPESLRMCV